MPYPYIKTAGNLTSCFTQFRKSFPSKIDPEMLKKLGLAPGNEANIVTVFKFLGLIDADCQKNELGINLFTLHDNNEFAKALEDILSKQYSALIEARGQEAWNLDRNALITFFRTSDRSSDITGGRQALAFEVLASLANKRAGEVKKRAPSMSKSLNSSKSVAAKTPKSNNQDSPSQTGKSELNIHSNSTGKVNLSVRVEINLPSGATQETYDFIFRSIKKNLIDG